MSPIAAAAFGRTDASRHGFARRKSGGSTWRTTARGLSPALVVVLRRDATSLTPEEIALIREKFPDQEVDFRRTDPRDYKEHAAQCDELQPAMVLLPLERPIPSLAMEKGFPHVAITADGIMELLPLVPTFKPFEPKA